MTGPVEERDGQHEVEGKDEKTNEMNTEHGNPQVDDGLGLGTDDPGLRPTGVTCPRPRLGRSGLCPP